MANPQRKPTHRKFQDLAGLKVHEWTVLGCVGRNEHGRRLWLCECSCGVRKPWTSGYIKNPDFAESCGCKRPTAEQRFWSFVLKSDADGGCWEWQGGFSPNGYGHFGVGRKQQWPAHRFAYHHCIGPIPAGLFVCHHCDNPKCVRPDHLFLGTVADNNADATRKGHRASRLKPPQVMDIYRRWHAGSVAKNALAREYGVTPRTVFLIVNKRLWRDVTAHLE